LPDNPLLPRQKLRELHALMLRVRKLERRHRHANAREALLASALMHLSAGDLVSAPASDRTLRELAPTHPEKAHTDLPAALRLPLCAGAARGMLTAATDRVVAVYAEAVAPEPGWADALTWVYRDQLPLILICADSTHSDAHPRRSAANAPALTWPAVGQLAKKLHLPLFPVDGEDAVAVYRVMQEASSRARSGGGPSVLWAVLTNQPLPKAQQPLTRLEAYLRARDISLHD
jgi:TPP-dependent pyruvate/acetoin dehydrogenase alpha subunit